jgi:hypothetical protein
MGKIDSSLTDNILFENSRLKPAVNKTTIYFTIFCPLKCLMPVYSGLLANGGI